jgi:hypothetical protein
MLLPLAHPAGHAQVEFGEAVVVIAGQEQPGEKIDISIPITMKGQVNPVLAFIGTRQDILAAKFRIWLSIVGRLEPGVTARGGLADLDPMFRSSVCEGGLSGLPFDSPATHRFYLRSKLQVDSAGRGLAALDPGHHLPEDNQYAGEALLRIAN